MCEFDTFIGRLLVTQLSFPVGQAQRLDSEGIVVSKVLALAFSEFHQCCLLISDRLHKGSSDISEPVSFPECDSRGQQGLIFAPQHQDAWTASRENQLLLNH